MGVLLKREADVIICTYLEGEVARSSIWDGAFLIYEHNLHNSRSNWFFNTRVQKWDPDLCWLEHQRPFWEGKRAKATGYPNLIVEWVNYETGNVHLIDEDTGEGLLTFFSFFLKKR